MPGLLVRGSGDDVKPVHAPGRDCGCGGHHARAGSGAGRAIRARRCLQARLVDGVELRRRDGLQLADDLVAGGCTPPIVSAAAEIPVRAVVGEDEAEVLKSMQDDLCVGCEAGDVEGRTEPEPGAHRREGSRARARVVRPRPYVAMRAVGREADRMRDAPGQDLVGPEQQGRDGESGRVRGSPADRPHRIRREVPYCARPSRWLLAVREVLEVVDLIELAQALVDDQRVAVGARSGGRPTLDERRLVDRIALRRVITLRVVAERWGQPRAGGRRQVDRHPVPLRERPEVGVQVLVLGHVALPRFALSVDRQRRDVGIEDVVAWEQSAGRAGQRLGRRRHRCGKRSQRNERGDAQPVWKDGHVPPA